MQQILCGSVQRAYKLQSHQLLAATAAVQVGGQPLRYNRQHI
jgi:hypothetical protein